MTLLLEKNRGRPDKKHWPGLLRDYVEKRRAGGASKEDAVKGGMHDMLVLWGISMDSPKDLTQ